MRYLPQFEVYIDGDPDQAARAWFTSRSDAEFLIKRLSPERIGTGFEWKIRPVTTPLTEEWIVGNTIGTVHHVEYQAKGSQGAERVREVIGYGDVQSRLVSPWSIHDAV